MNFSRPQKPTFPGGEFSINSDGFFDLDHLPSSVLVIGTGYIGVEMAGILNALGAKVSVMCRGTEVSF